MMGLGKPQPLAKFEVAGFIYYGNIREIAYIPNLTVMPTPRSNLLDKIVCHSASKLKAKNILKLVKVIFTQCMINKKVNDTDS